MGAVSVVALANGQVTGPSPVRRASASNLSGAGKAGAASVVPQWWRLAAVLAAASLLLLALNTQPSMLPLYGFRARRLELFGGLGGTTTAALPQAPPLPRCDLDVKDSPFAKHCTLLRNVCVDQGRVVLYDKRHQPGARNGPPLGVRDLVPTERQTPYHFTYWRSSRKHLFAPLPPVRVRPASGREPRAYLDDPRFSTCTVPIVYWPHFDFNYVHSLRDNAAPFFSALRETPWAAHARIAYMTGGGLALSPMTAQLWQPLSPLRVDSWEEFSLRLPDGPDGVPAAPPGDAARRPASYEGGPQRCFAAMYACTKDVAGERLHLHEYGRHLAAWYRREEPEALDAARTALLAGVAPDLPRPPPVSALRTLGGTGKRAGGSGAPAPAPVQLRVVFQRRDRDRLLDNAAELLRRCNEWRHTAPSGAHVTALCWETGLLDLITGVAAAQEADVFVAAHGANTANAWLMRNGSSLVELTMHGFEEACDARECAHANVPTRNARDTDTQLQVWKLLLCDPKGSWTPGEEEAEARAQGVAPTPELRLKWAKRRNLVVRWEALEVALNAVVDTAGDMAAYWARYEAGDWWWLAGAQRVVPAGPNIRATTCSKAHAKGLVD